jgi:hypothetical protein
MYSEPISQSGSTNVHTLEDFLRENKNSPDFGEIQAKWDEQKNRWLIELRQLFRTIEGWLDGLKDTGPVTYSEMEETINEEYLGNYKVPIMFVTFVDKRVVIRPIGTKIFGGLGRVDILGPNGKRTLVMKEWGDWQFFSRDVISSTDVRTNYEPFTEESFKEEMFALIVDQWQY